MINWDNKKCKNELEMFGYSFKGITINKPILDISPLSWNQFKPDVNFKQKGYSWLSRGLTKKIKNFIIYPRN